LIDNVVFQIIAATGNSLMFACIVNHLLSDVS